MKISISNMLLSVFATTKNHKRKTIKLHPFIPKVGKKKDDGNK
jgi:hypothetical protein